MRTAWVFFLAAATQVLWVGAVDHDPHGEPVSELNSDVDYRDFTETVDSTTEASKKANDGTVDHKDQHGSDNNTVLSLEHDVFPGHNHTPAILFHRDCNNYNCATEPYYSRMYEDLRVRFILVSVALLICWTMLVILKWRMSTMRGSGYSPALMENPSYELRLYRIRTRTIGPNPPTTPDPPAKPATPNPPAQRACNSHRDMV